MAVILGPFAIKMGYIQVKRYPKSLEKNSEKYVKDLKTNLVINVNFNDSHIEDQKSNRVGLMANILPP